MPARLQSICSTDGVHCCCYWRCWALPSPPSRTHEPHRAGATVCLTNSDSGYPGYRGKIVREAGTLAEMLRPHGYRNYMVGKWHITPLPETGPTGPTRDMFRLLISWSGLDIGRDRGSLVSQYTSPFAFTGKLSKFTVTIDNDQALDAEAAGRAEMGRQ
jgi:arylsulfatase A-like enzyme